MESVAPISQFLLKLHDLIDIASTSRVSIAECIVEVPVINADVIIPKSPKRGHAVSVTKLFLFISQFKTIVETKPSEPLPRFL